jgi:hypothetical protein
MIHQASQGLASLGRNGDSMLVHMSPNEVAGLQGLAMSQGGSLTINPDTGMPEAFNLGNFFTSLLPTVVGSMVAPGFGTTAALMAGAATGAGLAAAKGDNVLMGGLMGGLGGYGGADIGKALAGAAGSGAATGAATGAAGITGSTGEIGSNLLTASKGIAPGATSATANAAGNIYDMADTAVNRAGLAAGNVNPALTNAQNLAISSGMGPGSASAGSSAFNPLQELKTSAKGIGNLISGEPGAWEAAKLAGGENIGTKMALTGAGGLLGGLEPTDIYGKPLKSEEDKYDPYASLNLSGDTGLRLYALGGTVGNPSVGGGLSDLYNRPEGQALENISGDGYGIGRLNNLAAQQSNEQAKTLGYAMGGLTALKSGGQPGGYLDGQGDGMSDSIPATIEGKQPARLADGEFVVPADVVSHLGNGSSKAGSKRLYAMLDKVRHARTGNKKQGKEINPAKYMPA